MWSARKRPAASPSRDVDRSGGRNQEVLFRLARTDPHPCQTCHESPTGPSAHEGMSSPMYEGVDTSGLKSIASSAMSWDYLKRIRDATKMKCVIKGILAPRTPSSPPTMAYDAIIVSNHGGRADEAGESTIEALPEIIEAVGGRTTVLIDSGFGAAPTSSRRWPWARPASRSGGPICGPGAFGEPGVEACWNCSASSCWQPCSRPARRPSSISCRRW